MRILFILENYLPHVGGVETVFKNLTEGLAKKGHDVSILTHRLKSTEKSENINGVKVIRVNCFHSRYWFSFFAIPKAIKFAKSADIIHTTTYNGSLPARIAARVCKKPSIITVHEILGRNWEEFGIGYLSAKFHQILERVITRLKFDEFVAVSESTKRQLVDCGVDEKKVNVVYNGVDYEHFDAKKYEREEMRNKLKVSKNFVYTFYGRPGISKGIEHLLRAVPEISKRIPDSKLMLMMSKSPENRYRYIMKLLKEIEIEEKILFLEPVKHEELPKYLAASDCIVVPSLSEGFGYAVAESCALGIPVVASNTTSIPEVVSGKHVLVEPKNPQAIAKGVVQVFNKKYKIEKLKKFTIEENIKNYLKIYKILVSRGN